jgi:glycosyltransferase involved in cell wall biosynthesis
MTLMNTLTTPIPPIVSARRAAAATPAPAVEVVIPVYNEARTIEASVLELRRYMREHLDLAFRITVADNASVDTTLRRAQALAAALPEVEALHLDLKGRGRALRAAWSRSDAEVLAYMDVDLSSDLRALPALLAPLLAGSADVAIGSRLTGGAEVTRSVRRELISRAYNMLLRVGLGVGFSDAQCGFKALRREILGPLLALVQDDSWFFDTELLYQAQRSGLSIHEVPVHWVEDTDSRVRILATVREDLRGIQRLRAAERAARIASRAGAPRRDLTSAPAPAE